MAKKIKDENGNTYVQKKPFYKRVWFWILAIIAIIIIAASMGGGLDSDSSKSGSKSSDSATAKPKEEKNTAKAVTLNAGTWVVGKDVQPGRYVVKATNGSGNFTDDSGNINVILGTTPDNEMGQVDSYTTDLKKNDKIKLSGIESASFTPTPDKRTEMTDLTAGTWVVGKDIKAGRYDITATAGSGNLSTDDGDVNEILGMTKDNDSGQVTKVSVNLQNGQILETSLEGIKLTAK